MTRSKPELQLEAIGEKVTKLLNEVGNEKKGKTGASSNKNFFFSLQNS